jgi:phospholipase C
MSIERRKFLQLLTTGAAGAAFPPSIARALEIPAHNRSRSIRDVEHVVIMMQENRSFDHYFGTLRGVRGFGDPRAVRLPSGAPVWYQPNGQTHLLPFHPGAPNLGLQFVEDLAHDWTTTQAAWNGGKYDQWVPQKGTTTMAHMVRSDIPWHYALADAFTVCDAYHCSLLGPTDPNRYYMWTGWVGNDGSGGGPVVDNAEAGYDWSTFPERLQASGVTWKVYQDIGLGLTAAGSWGWTADDAYIGNYGDNSLLYFHQYQNALPGTPLADRAKTGTNIAASGNLFDEFRKDVANGNLPQVSWIVAPEAYTEHPNWPANYGAWYVSQILDALTSVPEVWSKTAFFLTYDENDGFFDHVVPPTVPQTRAGGLSTVDTSNEIYPGTAEYPSGPYGLGIRVPMVVVSPWSKGGFVASEVFDHSSLIRFLEERFGPDYPGLFEPNITPWRRAVCGDLTSAFNFTSPNNRRVPLPTTQAYLPPDNQRHPDYKPVPPETQALPVQEPGTRPARPVPYELHVSAKTSFSSSDVALHFRNTGANAAVLQVRSGDGSEGPWTFTVGSKAELSDTWPLTQNAWTQYDLSVYGPNGFLRVYRGSIAPSSAANLQTHTAYDKAGNGITLQITNKGEDRVKVSIRDAYTFRTGQHALASNETLSRYWSLDKFHGWYDFTLTVDNDPNFLQQLAGHVETGNESVTDPAIGS